MRLNYAPFIKSEDKASGVMLDAVIALAFLLIVPVAYYGHRAVALAVVGAAAAVVCEALWCFALRRKLSIFDLSAVVTGLIIALLLPVSAPYWMPVAGAVFAISVVKMPFGGLGRNIFNPAAAGVAFLTVCRSYLVFTYPDPGELNRLALFNPDFKAVLSPDAMLKSGIRPDIGKLEWLLGNFAGPMGATAVLVILACGVYLLYRRAAAFQVPLGFVAACALFVLLFPRIEAPYIDLLICELLSGSVVFCAVFVAGDPVTSPKHWLARLIYGVMGGLICMIFRYFSAYQQGAVFAILLINPFSAALDRAVWYILRKRGARHEA